MSLCDVCHKEEASVGPFCRRCADALLEEEWKRWHRLFLIGQAEALETSSRMEECTECSGKCGKCMGVEL